MDAETMSSAQKGEMLFFDILAGARFANDLDIQKERNKIQTAQILGIDRKTLRNKIKKLNLPEATPNV